MTMAKAAATAKPNTITTRTVTSRAQGLLSSHSAKQFVEETHQC